jgi:lysophospholipase L1-like esterase
MDTAREKAAGRGGRGGGKARGCLFRLAALTFSFTLALVVAELAVRLVMPQVIFPRYVTDGGFGVRVNVPSVRYWHTSPEMRAEFRINSKGIRSDREDAFEKAPGTLRVVCLGDSFTQGYEVEVESSYPYLLEKALRERGLRVEVLNLGVSGFGTAEELIMLTEYGLRFDPDAVVVGYYQNDPGDSVRSGLYRVDERGELHRGAKSYLPAVGVRDALYKFWIYRWIAQHSHLANMVREQAAVMLKRDMYRENLSEIGARGQPGGPAPEALLTARLLDQIKLECARRGIDLVILDIPDHLYAESNLPASLLREVRDDEIVRTLPALREEARTSDPYRRRGHFHWTPAGHAVGARLLAEHLEPILRRRSGP